MAMKQRMKAGPRKTVTSLQVMAKLWPTPQTHDVRKRGNTNADAHYYPHVLAYAVEEPHHFSPTSSSSTEQPSPASISSQGDFLASHSVAPGSEGARRMTVISGRKCSVLLRKRDPLGCLEKTLLESSAWN